MAPASGHAPLEIRVECSPGSGQPPRAFELAGRRVTVAEILDRWPGRDHRYFKVRSSDGAVYILRHDPGSDRWELTLFDSGRHPGTRLSST